MTPRSRRSSDCIAAASPSLVSLRANTRRAWIESMPFVARLPRTANCESDPNCRLSFVSGVNGDGASTDPRHAGAEVRRRPLRDKALSHCQTRSPRSRNASWPDLWKRRPPRRRIGPARPSGGGVTASVWRRVIGARTGFSLTAVGNRPWRRNNSFVEIGNRATLARWPARTAPQRGAWRQGGGEGRISYLESL
jgi:hypothetical protein